MTFARQLISAACICALLGNAVAQGLASPRLLAVGESWTYQVHDGPFADGSFSFEIENRTDSGYTIKSIERSSKMASPPDELTSNLDWIRNVRGSDPVALCWVVFPLAVGRTWPCKTTTISQSGAPVENTFEYRVEGTEKITVKAGTFESFKIVGKGRWKNLASGLSDLSTITIWFAPDVGGIARYARENWPKNPGNPQVRMELVKHSTP